jgi:hypothetical protein
MQSEGAELLKGIGGADGPRAGREDAQLIARRGGGEQGAQAAQRLPWGGG